MLHFDTSYKARIHDQRWKLQYSRRLGKGVFRKMSVCLFRPRSNILSLVGTGDPWLIDMELALQPYRYLGRFDTDQGEIFYQDFFSGTIYISRIMYTYFFQFHCRDDKTSAVTVPTKKRSRYCKDGAHQTMRLCCFKNVPNQVKDCSKRPLHATNFFWNENV